VLITPPSYLPSNWCRQTIPILTAIFPTGTAVPAYGDVVSLNGATTTGGLTLVGFEVTGAQRPLLGRLLRRPPYEPDNRRNTDSLGALDGEADG
jgi:hypothetical protein